MAHRFIDGPASDALLRLTREPVKLVTRSGESATVPAVQALRLARDGGWVGKVSVTGKLRYLRELSLDQRTFPVDRALWNGRACIRFTRDLRAIPESVRRREEAARLDRMLALDPPPRSR